MDIDDQRTLTSRRAKMWTEIKGWLLLPVVLVIDWIFGPDLEA